MQVVMLNNKQSTSKKGFMALVDDEDYTKISKYSWYVQNHRNTFYADAHIKGSTKRLRMHRLLMNPPKGMIIDHINGNGLDNRKENLRVCTPAQNRMNRTAKIRNIYKYKGIYKNNNCQSFGASIGVNGKKIYLGSFPTPREAAIAYNKAAKQYHGEFARLNIIKELYEN